MLMYYGLLVPKCTVYKRNVKLIYRTWYSLHLILIRIILVSL